MYPNIVKIVLEERVLGLNSNKTLGKAKKSPGIEGDGVQIWAKGPGQNLAIGRRGEGEGV